MGEAGAGTACKTAIAFPACDIWGEHWRGDPLPKQELNSFVQVGEPQSGISDTSSWTTNGGVMDSWSACGRREWNRVRLLQDSVCYLVQLFWQVDWIKMKAMKGCQKCQTPPHKKSYQDLTWSSLSFQDTAGSCIQSDHAWWHVMDD